MKVTLRIGGAERAAEVTRRDGRIVVRLGPIIASDGATTTAPPAVPDDAPSTAYIVRPERDGTWTLVDAADEARRIPLAGTAHGTDRQVWTAGRTVRYRRVVAGGAARHVADAAGLAAVIPSVVLDVLVAPGDTVADGQKLILLESMKMVVAIQAPFAGVVTAVHCNKGDAVQPGTALLAMEPIAAATATATATI
ncbi:MAG: biotin/lipoyl-binding protein [Ardenticatenales bacterium]|nr:biotin/lipoyl-binding protein [Ardenticatenales bacterium]